MGASRKLQGEIDRVLKKVQEGVEVFDSIWNKVYDTDNANQKEKFEADLKKEIKKLQRYRDQIKTWIQSSEIKDKKVSASYEQALMDARKLIEREMERFKICEKETKTKAFSKEGLGQQPKTDPKEKAKSETRDWLNNVVGEMESQIDNFEAEIEGLSVKKGRSRPPRLTHLETSIVRHKAHIMKLELILRLLDNDELSPEQVNDIKDFLEDYVERNQEDFEDFEEVDEFYSSLPLDKVESLEDLVTTGPPGHPKVSAGVSTAKVGGASQVSSGNNNQQGQSDVLIEETSMGEDTAAVPSSSLDNADPETVPRTPSSKNISAMSSPSISAAAANPATTTSPAPSSPFSQIIITPAVHNTSPPLVLPATATPSPPPAPMKVVNETASASTPKEDDSAASAVVSMSKPLHGKPVLLSPSPGTTTIPPSNPLPCPATPDTSKRNPVPVSDPISSSTVVQPPPPPPPILSPLTGRMAMHQTTGNNNNNADSVFVGNDAPPSPSPLLSAAAVSSTRSFSPSLVQWRAGSASFQSQNEVPQFRGRTEIAPDQREKFLQRLQQVQQQQHLFTQQQKTPPPLMQQQVLHAQAASYIPQSDVTAGDSILNGGGETAKDGGHPVSMDVMMMMMTKPGLPGMAADAAVDPLRDVDSLLPAARRGGPDIGAVGDSVNAATAAGGGEDHRMSNLQMLESAFYKLPQAKDSERVRTYVPRHPAAAGSIPPSYPQTQAPIVNHPAFWERLGLDPIATDTLFFAFYYQQNSYQQYLAAKELKKQSWRYHRKYNTWFQRHEEPKVATDEYEQGTYVYFDFHVPPDDPQHGWCQRIKTDFAFEYNYLEDELPV